jgi:glycosyltransferase involved in cell wall biosynthesis
MNLNILMLSHGYPPTISGVSLVVQKVARAMVRRGHRVLVVTSSNTREPYESDDQGVHLVRVHAAPNPLWEEGPIPYASRRHLDRLLDVFWPDVVHSHDPAILAWQAQRLCSEYHIPLLATCYYVPRFLARHLSPTREPSKMIESLGWAAAVWFFARHDHVVFATEAHRAVFAEAGLDVSTSIISNGTDTQRYRPPATDNGERARIEKRYSLPEGKRILFVGRLAKDKEIDTLVEGLATVRDRCNAHLLLVGRGDYRDELEERISEWHLEERCHLLGFVPEADMPALYRAVDLFAIAATTEVQSLPTLQACATGLPVVAADAMALPELVHDGCNGRLAPPDNPEAFGRAFLDILSDPDLCQRMGAESVQIAAPHEESLTMDAYEMLYERLASERSLLMPAPARVA